MGKVAAELNLVPEGTLLETEKVVEARLERTRKNLSDQIKPLLGVLDRYVMDVETLRDTKIGRIVRRYSRHEDPEVQEVISRYEFDRAPLFRLVKASLQSGKPCIEMPKLVNIRTLLFFNFCPGISSIALSQE